MKTAIVIHPPIRNLKFGQVVNVSPVKDKDYFSVVVDNFNFLLYAEEIQLCEDAYNYARNPYVLNPRQ